MPSQENVREFSLILEVSSMIFSLNHRALFASKSRRDDCASRIFELPCRGSPQIGDVERQRFFRLAKAGGDAAQRTIRTDMAAPAHSVIGRHRPALRLLPAAKIAVNVTRGADHRVSPVLVSRSPFL